MPDRRRSFVARSIPASRPTRGSSRTSTRSTPNMMPRKPIYEDGGFSGGNTDRPALQRLLDDMRAGKVDVIVVYKELPRVDNCILCPRLSQYMTPRIARSRSMKPRLTGFGVMQLPRSSKMRPASKVDRLTRSLADFAKLVELFDKHNVSFVSVTQQFNTTTSMGRLTLNVLLSFAQFEREVTSERIRDKIAASKRKGLWVGGMAPL